jgi:hypothetical protein
MITLITIITFLGYYFLTPFIPHYVITFFPHSSALGKDLDWELMDDTTLFLKIKADFALYVLHWMDEKARLYRFYLVFCWRRFEDYKRHVICLYDGKFFDNYCSAGGPSSCCIVYCSMWREEEFSFIVLVVKDIP